jgi:exopolyphosphatase/guanosine-5'-triphosphate,3'-diphosphate pyrophosphatase
MKRRARPRAARPRTPAAVAVIDIGSNSGRVVCYRADAAGQLRILATTRAALRLVADVDDRKKLSKKSIERTLVALRDFRAIALGAGARRIVAVGTAALRDASNGAALFRRVQRELGLRIEIIDGAREAQYGFLGAVRGLPVERGILFDVGGGSMQLTRFRARRALRRVSLPLGALRLSHRFLKSDPPREEQMHRLRAYVRRKLAKSGMSRLQLGDELVGTGGTIRNLANVDRRARSYPIARLHGYLLSRKRVAEIAALLGSRSLPERERIPGLSDERGDSIVGGALAIETLMEELAAERVRVSGEGVREGLAYSLIGEELPPVEAVRRSSIASLVSRFATWDAATAERRRALAGALGRRLLPRASGEVREALDHAAHLLDVGRSMDFFDRHEHVAEMVVATELLGFSHREVALVSAILLAARAERRGAKAWSPLLRDDDFDKVARAGLILALADDIEERCPKGVLIRMRVARRRRAVTIAVPELIAWRSRGLQARFLRLFGRALVVRNARQSFRED